MERLKRTVFNLKVYVIAFCFCNLLSMCLFTKWIYSITIPLMLVWGCMFCAYNFICKKFKWSFCTAVAFTFCVSYFIIILFRSSSMAKDIAQFMCIIVYFFVLFDAFSEMNRTEREKIIKINCDAVFWFNLPIAIISALIMYSGYYSEIVIQGETYLLGLIPRSEGCQLRGIGGSPTTFAVLEWLALMASIYLYKKSKKRILRVVIVMADIITWICLVAANANYLVLMLGAFAITLVLCLVLSKKAKACITVIVISVCVALLYKGTFGFIDYTVNGLHQMLAEKSEPDNSQSNSSLEEGDNRGATSDDVLDDPDDQVVEPAPPIVVERSLQSSTMGVRWTIWQEALKLFAENPFGVSKSNAKVEIFYGVPNYEYSNLHNGYLTILVSAGIQGLLMIVVFGVTLFIRVVYYMRVNHDDYTTQIAVALCIAILAGELVNGCFLFDRGLLYAFLWLILGHLYGQCKQSKDER